jgi:glycosyltransferase involved in cell wall biosynthesis
LKKRSESRGNNESGPRVLYFASTFDSGLSFYFTRLALAMHDVLPELIVITGSKQQENNLTDVLRKEKIKIYVNDIVDKPSLPNMVQGISFFNKLFKKENINVVHVQTVYALIMVYFSSIFVAKRNRIKIIITIHSTLHGTPFEKIGLIAGSFFYNIFADLIIPVCEDAGKKILKHGFNLKKMVVIHNGIDLKFFDMVSEDNHLVSVPDSLKYRSKINVSYFANFFERKGHKYLVKAISTIIKKGYNVNLILSSGGPIKNELIELVKKLNIEKNVYFIGRVSYEDLYRILNITDIFAFPSLSELFPFAILEAMAGAKPIITSNVGGINEAIIDGESGILIPCGSQKILSETLIETINNPEKAHVIGINARKRVEKYFEINIIAQKLVNCYKKILLK